MCEPADNAKDAETAQGFERSHLGDTVEDNGDDGDGDDDKIEHRPSVGPEFPEPARIHVEAELEGEEYSQREIERVPQVVAALGVEHSTRR